MKEADRERFLVALRADGEFRAAVRRELLTEELLSLPETVAALVDAVVAQRQDFSVLAQSVADYMERTISAFQDGFASLGGEIAGLRADTDAGFGSVGAKLDQVDAELQAIRDQLAS